MGSFSIWHWLIVIVVVMLLFGRGKISELMGDVATGIKAFKKGMSDEQTAATTETDGVKTINHENSAAAVKARSETEKQGSTA